MLFMACTIALECINFLYLSKPVFLNLHSNDSIFRECRIDYTFCYVQANYNTKSCLVDRLCLFIISLCDTVKRRSVFDR